MKYVAIGCNVYKVTENGNCWQLYKRFKTVRDAKGWVAHH